MSEAEAQQNDKMCIEEDNVDISGTSTVLDNTGSDEASDDTEEDDLDLKRSKLESSISNNFDNQLESAGKSENKKKIKKKEWETLEHKGPIFPPEYKALPDNVRFIYDKKEIKLSLAAEEVAGFYAKMLNHSYTEKKKFNENFFTDWCNVMTTEEKNLITDFAKCDFTNLNDYYKRLSENEKKRTDEEKKVLKSKHEKIQNEYGYCIMDGRKEKICNYKIEAPGLFRARGNHPKMGKLKTRVKPEEVTINCSKGKEPKPPAGHEWKKIIHDNSVSWLASWVGKVSEKTKYVELDPSAKLKHDKDRQKYDTAKKLHKYIDGIRKTYMEDSKNSTNSELERQRAVALYFIDKLALRAGNEKEEELADTVGCCSLRVEHVELYDLKENKTNVVELNFLGKDSIRYYNEISVEPHIYDNLNNFKEGKKDTDDLFDKLDTKSLNDYLKELMPELTSKVFRTYNASRTLQMKLDAFNNNNATEEQKIRYYIQANHEVATLCNHQQTTRVPDAAKIEKLRNKIILKRREVACANTEVSKERARRDLTKLEKILDESENKKVALSTSKLHYMDPRITIAWCHKHNIPIHKVYKSKGLRSKFKWAIELADYDFVFG